MLPHLGAPHTTGVAGYLERPQHGVTGPGVDREPRETRGTAGGVPRTEVPRVGGHHERDRTSRAQVSHRLTRHDPDAAGSQRRDQSVRREPWPSRPTVRPVEGAGSRIGRHHLNDERQDVVDGGVVVQRHGDRHRPEPGAARR